jgi:hypothetical protein
MTSTTNLKESYKMKITADFALPSPLRCQHCGEDPRSEEGLAWAYVYLPLTDDRHEWRWVCRSCVVTDALGDGVRVKVHVSLTEHQDGTTSLETP